MTISLNFLPPWAGVKCDGYRRRELPYIYFNGAADAPYNKVFDGAYNQATDVNRMVAVGSYADVATGFSNVKAHSVSVWNTALSAAAITSIYNAGNGYALDLRTSSGNYTQTSNLMHYWNLGYQLSPNLGKDLGSGTAIDIQTNSSSISDTDVFSFP